MAPPAVRLTSAALATLPAAPRWSGMPADAFFRACASDSSLPREDIVNALAESPLIINAPRGRGE